MSLLEAGRFVQDEGFPRVSGDEPVEDGSDEFGPGFSPRERG